MTDYVTLYTPNGPVPVRYERRYQRKRTGLGNASGTVASPYVRGLMVGAADYLGLLVADDVARCAACGIVGSFGRGTVDVGTTFGRSYLPTLEADRVALDLPGWSAPDGLPYAPQTVAPVCGRENGDQSARVRYTERLAEVARRLVER